MAKRIFLISVLALLAFSFACGANFALAKYPEKKIRLIIPYAPGGGIDIVARPLAHYVNPYLDNRVYCENLPGAAGAIGSREGAKAAPDGYTLTMLHAALMMGQHTMKDFPTYTLFDPICIVCQDCITLVVNVDSHFRTANDLISYAKAHPGEVSVGITGHGDGSHFAGLALSEAFGIKFSFVPYPGAGPAVTAIAGGHVDATIAGEASSLALVKGNKIRPLIVFGNKRSKLYPDTPIAKELGYDIYVPTFRGVGVPKGTPKEIKDVLVEAFRRAVEEEGFKKLMDQMGLDVMFLGPEEASPWLKALDDFFRNLAGQIGLKPK